MEELLRQQLECFCRQVRPVSRSAMEQARCHWDGIAKPLNGLGRLEELLVKIAGIQGKEQITISRRAVVVFCADNGVVAEGVTQTDSSVTAIMTNNLARGTASVNRMASIAGADVIPIDIGVCGEVSEPGVKNCRIAAGTKNLFCEPAMTPEQTLEALHTGITLAGSFKDAGYDLLAVGEMGIGNTTTSSAVASVLLQAEPELVTGRGAGLSSKGLERKLEVIRHAIALHHADPKRPLEVLAALGGFDLAGMAGLMLGGAIYQIPVVLDGMISAVAALVAYRLNPLVSEYLLPSHMGREPACRHIMEHLGLMPVIDADLALGEGTGAVMLFPMLDMAHAVYQEGGTFQQSQIRAYEKQV